MCVHVFNTEFNVQIKSNLLFQVCGTVLQRAVRLAFYTEELLMT